MLRLISRRIPNLDNCRKAVLSPSSLLFSSKPPPPEDPNKITDAKLKSKLSARFPQASDIHVEDISGGCGAMFAIYVEAPDFQGLNTVKQHKLINEALSEEIKTMHGIRITTGVTKSKK